MGTVKYLLDTHTFLWAVQKDVMLNAKVRYIIEDSNTVLYISAVSAYEIINKYRIGKLNDYEYIAENYFEVLKKFNAEELHINTKHAHFAGKFEWTHCDPFDRPGRSGSSRSAGSAHRRPDRRVLQIRATAPPSGRTPWPPPTAAPSPWPRVAGRAP